MATDDNNEPQPDDTSSAESSREFVPPDPTIGFGEAGRIAASFMAALIIGLIMLSAFEGHVFEGMVWLP